MSDLAYFDSSVFLAIFNGEPSSANIKCLLRELRHRGARLCTSIITIQEVSVLSFRAGGTQVDNYAKVDRLARIHGITRDIALLAARMEAEMLDRYKAANKADRTDHNRRRKMDCLHVATAVQMKCHWLYSLDPQMLANAKLISGTSVKFCEPVPENPGLFGN